MDRGFKYLARDEGGALFAYKYKPEKRMQVWVVSKDAKDSEHQHFTQVNDWLGVYDTIQWEDKKPTEIETLKSAVRQPLVNPIEFGGLSIHEQKGGGTYIIKSDLYKSVLDQNAEKRKERFNELTGEKISEEPEEPEDSKVTRHKQITGELTAIYEAKNHDYGDSFQETYLKLGLISAVTRITDKVNRLQSLSTKEQRVAEESIKDTLMDCANYCIMTIIALEGEEE